MKRRGEGREKGRDACVLSERQGNAKGEGRGMGHIPTFEAPTE
jgi:hypothetical protein